MTGFSGLAVVLLVGAMVLRGGGEGYDAFLTGAKRGLDAAWRILPALCAMTLMIALMNASGLSRLLARVLTPLTGLLGLPEEVAPLLVLRPLSGSGSLTALQAIFEQCGVDSRAGRAASVLMGSSETIFYTLTVYLGATDVRRLPWVVPVSVVSYLAGAWVCGLVV